MQIVTIPLAHGGDKLHSPKSIVVHAIAEFIDHEPRDYFCVDWLDKMGLSAHALITPSGVIIRCREDNQNAWHAKGHNFESLAIEFLVPGLHTYGSFVKAIETNYLTERQYEAGVHQMKLWLAKNSVITDGQINRHSELSPVRKVDPGKGFPWKQFMEDIRR